MSADCMAWFYRLAVIGSLPVLEAKNHWEWLFWRVLVPASFVLARTAPHVGPGQRPVLVQAKSNSYFNALESRSFRADISNILRNLCDGFAVDGGGGFASSKSHWNNARLSANSKDKEQGSRDIQAVMVSES
ncbi:uncharacterized protein N7496_006009 [Penicillium cataractarum]|uniref:Uncharacterized protein n=1 Tax=Penicillium cataractarum TaxID=2100454 RepID=A0A9W9S1E5_9EURO|nr:uncharacterized protein N7496_006009 [Penicillium cataractarum]KAJ5369917.1 hypothetical protein N7496_006009 [Penicillium cataractarum]